MCCVIVGGNMIMRTNKLTLMKPLLLPLLCSYLLSISYALLGSEKIGVNYGRVGNNLPSPYQTIQLLRSTNTRLLKLYDANPEVLTLLSATKIRVSIMVPNDHISALASDADQWVRDNVLSFYPSTKIRFILVGNEVFTSDDVRMWLDLVPAIRNIKRALNDHHIHNIKVGTPAAMDVLESSFPPSTGKFRSDIPTQVIMPLLEFLNGTKSFFFLDAYPYFPWSQNPTISLDYALLKGGGGETHVDPETGFVYTNLLDQMIDAVVFAMAKLGFDDIKIAIAETGWPHDGDIDEPGANAYNAATYLCNLVDKMTAEPPLGTPAKPGVEIPTFVFSLYDENQKPGPGTERHWGMLDYLGRPTYEVDLSSTCPEGVKAGFPHLRKPANNKPYNGKIWCVVADTAQLTELAPALEFACGHGNGTCDELAPGKDCYEPVSIAAHASYAFSSYWARFRSSGASCYFNGLAVQTVTDPSHGSCKFPSVLV